MSELVLKPGAQTVTVVKVRGVFGKLNHGREVADYSKKKLECIAVPVRNIVNVIGIRPEHSKNEEIRGDKWMSIRRI